MADPQPAAPPDAPPPEAEYVVPSHGHGRLKPVRKGQVLNPSGQHGRYHEVVRMAREASTTVLAALIQIALDPKEDSRARIVAGQEVLGRAFGRIPAEIKGVESTAPTLDATKLSDRELAVLWRMVQAAQPKDE